MHHAPIIKKNKNSWNAKTILFHFSGLSPKLLISKYNRYGQSNKLQNNRCTLKVTTSYLSIPTSTFFHIISNKCPIKLWYPNIKQDSKKGHYLLSSVKQLTIEFTNQWEGLSKHNSFPLIKNGFIIDSKFTDYNICCITKTMVGG